MTSNLTDYFECDIQGCESNAGNLQFSPFFVTNHFTLNSALGDLFATLTVCSQSTALGLASRNSKNLTFFIKYDFEYNQIAVKTKI